MSDNLDQRRASAGPGPFADYQAPAALISVLDQFGARRFPATHACRAELPDWRRLNLDRHRVESTRRSAARRAFSLTLPVTQRDAVDRRSPRTTSDGLSGLRSRCPISWNLARQGLRSH